MKNHVFGPVASRRLGLSLGVDLVTPKCCSLDCIYCEAGSTTEHTLQRKEYVKIEEVKQQLHDVLAQKPEIDYITFSGAGEPALNSRIGDVVNFIKDNYPEYKLCLLTNGLLLYDPDVRREIARVDRVVPSLDASNAAEFEKINRPAAGITFEKYVDGLADYTHQSSAEVFLELFIVPGVNDSDESIKRFVDIIRRMKLNMVQLNTLDRPGVVDWIRPSSKENTMRFIQALEPYVPVEAVGPFRYKSRSLRHIQMAEEQLDLAIIDLASRRPVTVADLAEALDIEPVDLVGRCRKLVDYGLLTSERGERGEFFGKA